MLRELIQQIDETHYQLGSLVAISLLCCKARKALMIVSPPGCGKSTAMELIAETWPDALTPDRTSVAGLGNMADKLNGYSGVIIVDDIATTQTDYARLSTVTALTSLVYTHRLQSSMGGEAGAYEISDFYGAAIIGIQPVLIKILMDDDVWDASIQDKCLRYYHLYRPTEPNVKPLDIQIDRGIDIEQVQDFTPSGDTWKALAKIALTQWGTSRTLLHLKDLLRAVAALESRFDVIEDDYDFLLDLLRPMALEQIAMKKTSLEGGREFDNTLIALLAEYYTYGGEFSLANLSIDYKVSVSQAYKIMKQQNGLWDEISKSPTRYRPSKLLNKQLDMYKLQNKEVID